MSGTIRPNPPASQPKSLVSSKKLETPRRKSRFGLKVPRGGPRPLGECRLNSRGDVYGVRSTW